MHIGDGFHLLATHLLPASLVPGSVMVKVLPKLCKVALVATSVARLHRLEREVVWYNGLVLGQYSRGDRFVYDFCCAGQAPRCAQKSRCSATVVAQPLYLASSIDFLRRFRHVEVTTSLFKFLPW